MNQEYLVNRFKVHGVSVLHYPTLSKITNVRINVLCGSCLESPREYGTAHFLEHMILAGTPTVSAEQFAGKMTFLGAPNNAYTSLENTSYYASVLSGNFEKVFALLADAFLHAEFKEEHIEREKKVILEEIKMRQDDPGCFAWETMFSGFFGDKFGHTVIGNEDVVESITRKKLLKFRKRWYNRNNVQISVASNLDQAEVKEAISKYFEKLPNGKKGDANYKIKCDYTPLSVTKAGIQQAHYMLSTDFEIPKGGFSKRSYAISFFGYLFGGNQASVLFQELREKRGLCYDASTSVSSYRSIGYFLLGVDLDPANIEMLEQAIKEVRDTIINEYINKDSLCMFRNKILSTIAMRHETSGGVNELSTSELKGWKNHADRSVEYINKLTVKDIKQAADFILSKPMKKVIILPE